MKLSNTAHVRFGFLKPVTTKKAVFCDMTSKNLGDIYLCFEITIAFIYMAKETMLCFEEQAVDSSRTLVGFSQSARLHISEDRIFSKI